MNKLFLIFLMPVLASPVCAALKKEFFFSPLNKKQPVEVAAGQAMVKFASGIGKDKKISLLKSAGIKIIEDLEFNGWILAGLPEGMSVKSGIDKLAGVSGISAAEPNHIYKPLKVPNDPLVPMQYALGQIGAFSAWEYEVGISCRVTIAVVDTGIDGSHPELSGKLTGISQFFNAGRSDNNPPTPACNHATHVAGIAAASADNSAQIAGISWGAGLISLKVFRDSDCNPAGDCPEIGCETTDNIIVNAMNYAASLHNSTAAGKIIINLSLGESGTACSSLVQDAVSSAAAAGVVIVAAAGNDGSYVNSPANCIGVIPVGATDSNDEVASFSSRGSELAERGVAAPGVNILTTDISSGVAYDDGTSFASPMVAGLAALIISARPEYTPSQVRYILRNSADDLGTAGPDNIYGAGRINAFRALRISAKDAFTKAPDLENSTSTARAGIQDVFKGDEKPIAYPNPFRVSSHKRVEFAFPISIQSSGLEIKIYTMQGELVRSLHSKSWDGKNEYGQFVASGIYIFRIKSDTGSGKGRIAVIR